MCALVTGVQTCALPIYPKAGGSEDPKEFMRRAVQDDDVVFGRLKALKIPPETIDGVEVYGVFGDDGNEARRDLPSDPPATKWCVSIHTTNPQLWMIDYGDYTSPDEIGRAHV